MYVCVYLGCVLCIGALWYGLGEGVDRKVRLHSITGLFII